MSDDRFHFIKHDTLFCVPSEDKKEKDNRFKNLPNLKRKINHEEPPQSSNSEESEPEKDLNTKYLAEYSGLECTSETNLTSNRLCLCNMEWTSVTTETIYVLVNSFLSSKGKILSVKIYISNYGKENMNKLTPHDNNYTASDQVRIAEFNKLKYYFCIIEFDSTETANKIYNDCDGFEFENSSVSLDFRYVPNDMKFDKPISTATCNDACEITTDSSHVASFNMTNPQSTWDVTRRDKSSVFNNLANFEDFDNLDIDDSLLGNDSSDDDESNVKRKKLFDDIKDDNFKSYRTKPSSHENIEIDWSNEFSSLDNDNEFLKTKKMQMKSQLNDSSKPKPKRKNKIESPSKTECDDTRFKKIYNDPNYFIDRTKIKHKGGRVHKKKLI
ncbi:hypothetical protein A3Q56_02362 [Intoshia linei]|uniref:ESF1 RRM domain-containing protein n=1 Tax=Intoshia linei TaxID=1819745 RepID=A0A177B8D7_9BILA|nr:hypothetical protein A3Q56_02362 [Intoshia linei]